MSWRHRGRETWDRGGPHTSYQSSYYGPRFSDPPNSYGDFHEDPAYMLAARERPFDHHGPDFAYHMSEGHGRSFREREIGRLPERRNDISRENSESFCRKIIPRKEIQSLPSLYLFSWDIFHEASYVDAISPSVVEPSDADGAENEPTVSDKVKTSVSKIFEKSPQVKSDELNNFLKYFRKINDSRDKRKLMHPSEIGCHIDYHNNQELINDSCAKKAPLYSRVSSSHVQELLANSAIALEEARDAKFSFDVQEKMKQHRLLILALIGQTYVSSSVYRVNGSALPQQWAYKRIHLVGDSRVHNLYNSEAWEGVPINRPFLYCKDDLSLFTLTSTIQELIPKVSVKGKSLVVCSVGLRDIVRTIDELGVLITLENTIADMKKIRQEFKTYYGDEHDLLFADFLPADVCTLLELHKDTLSIEESEELVELCNETTVKLLKFTYLLTQNMISEDLSRLKHLPSWEIFCNPVEAKLEDTCIKLPTLSEGFNPDLEKFNGISSRISDIYQSYCRLQQPPDFNSTKRSIFFVCNQKYQAMDEFWPKKITREKPKFIFLERVTSVTIVTSLRRHFPLPEYSILVVWFDVSEFLHSYSLSDCSCGSALKISLPRFLPPSHIYDELVRVRKALEQSCGSPNVVLTTLCPIDFPELFKTQLSAHKPSCQLIDVPSNNELEKIKQYHLAVVDKVNLYIVQSNRMKGLPAWDLCSFLYKRERDGCLTFIPLVSPSDFGPAKPQTAAKIMMCLSQCGQKTIQDLNWLEYCNDAMNVGKTGKRARSHTRRHSWSRSPPPRDRSEYYSAPRRSRSPGRAPLLPPPGTPFFDPLPDHRPTYPDNSARLTVPFHSYPSPYTREPSYYPEDPVHPRSVYHRLDADGRYPDNSIPTSTRHSEFEYHERRGYRPSPPRYPAPNTDFAMPAPSPPPAPPPLSLMSRYYKNAPSYDGSDDIFSSTAVPAAANLPEIPHIDAPDVLDPERKRVCFGLKAKEESRESGEQTQPAAATSATSSGGSLPDESALKSLIASLRAAHEVEVEKLRVNPKAHSKYEQQRQEFMRQALQSPTEDNKPMDAASVERVWLVFWKMQLEKSFAKTWEKRVTHLTTMLGGGKPLPAKSMEVIQKLTKIDFPPESMSYNEQQFTASESNLLNKFRKQKLSAGSFAPLPEIKKAPGVLLGEKMLTQVQRGWRNIGCKSSQSMVDNALTKLDDFIGKTGISREDREQYIDLRNKLRSFKAFLRTKEANPFDLDLKSLSEIAANFNRAEMREYVEGVLQTKGVQNPAHEDVIVTCEALIALQHRPRTAFVRGPILNP
ncbi:uncharacterized protein LOC108670153 [Hyalella azteca]|uniref:Uncharacterized protein LOC108670153 n=1 Tax=Hyalella azteca TaxID=294128 RepID=A0A8B7NIB0_HYAAZ|nr:uncharacterized protein LOC108670153 [Hyalella azteca]